MPTMALTDVAAVCHCLPVKRQASVACHTSAVTRQAPVPWHSLPPASDQRLPVKTAHRVHGYLVASLPLQWHCARLVDPGFVDSQMEAPGSLAERHCLAAVQPTEKVLSQLSHTLAAPLASVRASHDCPVWLWASVAQTVWRCYCRKKQSWPRQRWPQVPLARTDFVLVRVS